MKVESNADELELPSMQGPNDAEIDVYYSLRVGQRLLEPVKISFQQALNPNVSSQSRVLQNA